MLSTNTLLRDGRYRIGHAISSGRLGAIYTAEDQTTKQQVAVIVSTVSKTDADDARIENLIRLQHDGLVRITDNFQENGHSYEVSEPIKELEIFTESEEKPNETEIAEIFQRLSSILLALGNLRSEFPKLRFVEIMPENVIETADGKFKLLFVEMPGIFFARNPPDSPYLPFERVWNDLDLISQRAFYREFDDAALEKLESPPDARSDIYSLGAVFYKLLTGQSPLTAFERSFEMLDTKKDALHSLSSLNPAVNESQSQFVLKMLELKREDRFASFDEAVLSLPSSSLSNDVHVSQNPVIETDDLDLLLEIPTEPQLEHIDIRSNGHSAAAPVLDELAALSSMEVTPESATHTEELDSFVQQFYSQDRVEDHFASEKIVEEEPGLDVLEPVIEERKSTAQVFTVETKDAPQNAGFMKMIGIAVAGIVVVAAAGFGLLSLTSSDTAKSQDQTTYQAPTASLSTEPQQQPALSSEPVNQTTTMPNTASQGVDAQPEVQPTGAKTRPQIAEVKPTKTAQTKPSVKPEQKPKKKITVDDLLN